MSALFQIGTFFFAILIEPRIAVRFVFRWFSQEFTSLIAKSKCTIILNQFVMFCFFLLKILVQIDFVTNLILLPQVRQMIHLVPLIKLVILALNEAIMSKLNELIPFHHFLMDLFRLQLFTVF